MNEQDKRGLVTSLVFRFSPQTQEIKRRAIDEILLNTLYLSGRSLNFDQLCDELSGEENGLFVAPNELRKSISRCLDKDHVVEVTGGYRLTGQTSVEIATRKEEFRKKEERAINLAFRETTTGHNEKEAFMYALSKIFAAIGRESASLVLKNGAEGESIESDTVEKVATTVASKFSVDKDSIGRAIKRFFESSDPNVISLIWRFSQNFFIAHCIGIESENTDLLSGETLRKSDFYLDTNIVIPILESASPTHRAVSLLQNKSDSMDFRFFVLQDTIEELKSWVNYNYGKVQRVVGVVPEECLRNISSLFMDIYRSFPDDEDVEIKDIFASFANPKESLQDKYNADVLSGIYIDPIRDSEDTKIIKSRILSAVEKANKFKETNQIEHDAILISYVKNARSEGFKNSWVLTADKTLASAFIKDKNGGPLVLTIQALLQWLSPTMTSSGDSDEFRSVFADMIRDRLLPQTQLFTIEQYAVFNDLGISVSELPAEDVDDCVKYIDNNISDVDLGSAEGREKMYSRISQFFASPDRRQNATIADLRRENKKLKTRLDRKERNEKLLKENVENLNKIVGKMEKREIHRKKYTKVRNSILLRLLGVVIIALLAVGAMSGVMLWADPEYNSFISVLASWQALLAFLSVVTLGTWVYVKPQRLNGVRSDDLM
jgi:hypothetical protein